MPKKKVFSRHFSDILPQNQNFIAISEGLLQATIFPWPVFSDILRSGAVLAVMERQLHSRSSFAFESTSMIWWFLSFHLHPILAATFTETKRGNIDHQFFRDIKILQNSRGHGNTVSAFPAMPARVPIVAAAATRATARIAARAATRSADQAVSARSVHARIARQLWEFCAYSHIAVCKQENKCWNRWVTLFAVKSSSLYINTKITSWTSCLNYSTCSDCCASFWCEGFAECCATSSLTWQSIHYYILFNSLYCLLVNWQNIESTILLRGFIP